MPAAVPLVVESPLPVAEARLLLAARLDERATLHGRVDGDAVLVRRAPPAGKRRTPALAARLELAPGGGTRLVGTVAPDFMLLLPAVLAFVAFVIGVETRIPLVALLGAVGGFVSWRAFRRSARVEAEALRQVLVSLLQPPPRPGDA